MSIKNLFKQERSGYKALTEAVIPYNASRAKHGSSSIQHLLQLLGVFVCGSLLTLGIEVLAGRLVDVGSIKSTLAAQIVHVQSTWP